MLVYFRNSTKAIVAGTSKRGGAWKDMKEIRGARSYRVSLSLVRKL